jgi:hypothetical protein
MLMLTNTIKDSSSNPPSSASAALPDLLLNNSDPRDSSRNATLKEVAHQMHLAWVFSTPSNLKLVFPLNMKHLVTCEIDLSGGKCAIEVKVETFGPSGLFKDMKAMFDSSRLQKTTNKCCFSDPQEIAESDSYSFYIFPPAEISDVSRDVVSSNYPVGAGTGTPPVAIKALIVTFEYVLAKDEFKDAGDAVEAQRKRMKLESG